MSTSIKVRNILLSNGSQMPIFGLGTAGSKNIQEMTNLIRAALDVGYRHIDTAKFYGNEHMIGTALHTIFAEGKYKRSDIYLVTKILPFKDWNTKEVVAQQLKDLQVDYLDLLILHSPFAPPKDKFEWNHKPVHVQWAELEELYNKGLTRALGISNFNTQSVVDLLTYAKVKPVINQIELHVFNQQRRFVEFLKKVNVYPVAYSPMARYQDVINNEIVAAVAKKNNASVAQVLLAFLLQQDIVVIPKTEKLERLGQNLNSLNLVLSEEDLEALKKLDSKTRIVDVQHSDAAFRGVPIFD